LRARAEPEAFDFRVKSPNHDRDAFFGVSDFAFSRTAASHPNATPTTDLPAVLRE
jgi:hypothetical protein